MPKRPTSSCSVPTCPNRKPCPQHQRPAWHRPYDQRSSTARGYGHPWQKLAAQVRAEEPYCRIHLQRGNYVPGEEVDHIIPKAQGGTSVRSNLQHLCRSCHRHKTASRDSKGKAVRKVYGLRSSRPLPFRPSRGREKHDRGVS